MVDILDGFFGGTHHFLQKRNTIMTEKRRANSHTFIGFPTIDVKLSPKSE